MAAVYLRLAISSSMQPGGNHRWDVPRCEVWIVHRTSLHNVRSDLLSDVYLRFSEGELRVHLVPQRTGQAGGEEFLKHEPAVNHRGSYKQKYANVLCCSLTTSFSEATAACERVFPFWSSSCTCPWSAHHPLTTSDSTRLPQGSLWSVCEWKEFEQLLFVWWKHFQQRGVHFEGLWADSLWKVWPAVLPALRWTCRCVCFRGRVLVTPLMISLRFSPLALILDFWKRWCTSALNVHRHSWCSISTSSLCLVFWPSSPLAWNVWTSLLCMSLWSS